MRLKKYFMPAFLIGVALSLTGCGESFPSLTEEEYDQTVEYAVGLLMKYSKNGQAKLTYVDVETEKKKRAEKLEKPGFKEETDNGLSDYKDDVEDVSLAGNEASLGTSVTVEVDAKESAVNGSESTSDSSSESGSDESAESSSKENTGSDTNGNLKKELSGNGDTDAITLSADDTQEVLDDIFLSYQGYSVSSTYPERSKSYVINADKGKKLLVLRFDFYNASDSAKEVNMLKLDLLFQIILNNKNIGYSSVTFLPNDLTSYIGTIEPKAHESLAILTQVDEKNSSNVESLGLIMTRKGKDQNIILK